MILSKFQVSNTKQIETIAKKQKLCHFFVKNRYKIVLLYCIEKQVILKSKKIPLRMI
jgi:hypothetical protein